MPKDNVWHLQQYIREALPLAVCLHAAAGCQLQQQHDDDASEVESAGCTAANTSAAIAEVGAAAEMFLGEAAAFLLGEERVASNQDPPK
ncbi:hypothetical protein cyc_09277 [Cyclospora cayetanensis]|uniref:Uncharacterized protein n=1 Tax=Cyclospora cayetanensis TaxID=88456 RepID=A0A1D3CTG1_9EIME|nr:hypothetical protein cyc_09277 [Cyclospora cayetanensis]